MIPQLDDKYDRLAWGSHIVPLMACVASTRGPVLELGVGHFSTPVLHVVCKCSLREMVSVEDNKEWADMFHDRYSDAQHAVLFVTSYDDVGFLTKKRWGVVFIDNSPGGERRKKDFLNYIDISDYVVVHDYELDNKEAIQPLLDAGDIRYKVYSEYTPPTLVATKKHVFGVLSIL